MPFFLMFVGVPVLAYLALVALPRGRVAVGGILAAAVLVGIGVLVSGGGDPATAGLGQALLMFLGTALALAGFVQALRWRMIGPDAPRWAYPALVIVALLLALVPMLMLLGV